MQVEFRPRISIGHDVDAAAAEEDVAATSHFGLWVSFWMAIVGSCLANILKRLLGVFFDSIFGLFFRFVHTYVYADEWRFWFDIDLIEYCFPQRAQRMKRRRSVERFEFDLHFCTVHECIFFFLFFVRFVCCGKKRRADTSKAQRISKTKKYINLWIFPFGFLFTNVGSGGW